MGEQRVHVRGISTDCKVLWSIRRSDSHFVTKIGLDSLVSLILRIYLSVRLKSLKVRLTFKKSPFKEKNTRLVKNN